MSSMKSCAPTSKFSVMAQPGHTASVSLPPRFNRTDSGTGAPKHRAFAASINKIELHFEHVMKGVR